ncbi:hypothetical protein B0J13DRAFT_531649 [Dactylonectria estremocensis]|uniref:Uncharacterized protein n=1 Tax=Dactylonectria estremocensis TaxID=1079267 RepID=A0A9P9DMD9_9HYPO|nr:hypothetical protein B0J13DRAFT_531649 [Dactylonectria estremocensis]
MRGMEDDVGYNRVGLMGETVCGQVLAGLNREGQTTKANSLNAIMKSRAAQWDSEAVPFGSEMACDLTGQEGVYYWSWIGNTRHYWDNMYVLSLPTKPLVPRRLTKDKYGGKLRRIERQIHHYGSALNALALLSGFQSDAHDIYLLHAGYGGISGLLSSIHQDGFAAASFYSWPDTLQRDGCNGDSEPGFLGWRLVRGQGVKVHTTDAVRRKVFLGEVGVLLSVDAGVIESVEYSQGGGTEVVLGQLEGLPRAKGAVLWVEATGGKNYAVTKPLAEKFRGGWKISFGSTKTTVQLE